MSVRALSRLVALFKRTRGPIAPAPIAQPAEAGCNPAEEVAWLELLACWDVLVPDHAPWLPDLPPATVPELVIRCPIEGLPQVWFEDGRGNRVGRSDEMLDWLLAARSVGTLHVNANAVAALFAMYDNERLEGRPPGRLFQGEAEG